jgi:hypothetical protein
MAQWTKVTATMASALSCAASGTLSIPQATSGATGTFGTSLSIPNGSSISIAGAITNGGSALTAVAVVALLASIDSGTTWYQIDQAAGLLTASVHTPFSFNLIPDGVVLLTLYVYNNSATVTLNAIASYGSTFS